MTEKKEGNMALSNEDKQWIREALLETERRINDNTADYYNQLKAQVERLEQAVAGRIKA